MYVCTRYLFLKNLCFTQIFLNSATSLSSSHTAGLCPGMLSHLAKRDSGALLHPAKALAECHLTTPYPNHFLELFDLKTGIYFFFPLNHLDFHTKEC